VNGRQFNTMVMDNSRRARDNNVVFAWVGNYQSHLLQQGVTQDPSVSASTQATKNLDAPGDGVRARSEHR